MNPQHQRTGYLEMMESLADATLQENVKQIKLSQEQVVEGFKVYIKQKVD